MSTSSSSFTFGQLLDHAIAENRNTFRTSPNRIISDYQGEEGLRKAYDGRQLLEILQNADDACATKVQITLDTKRRKLTFSNTGNPFSAEGIISLMISNLSTKRGRRKMIGNKGLGFRSILNWADKITICRRDALIEFSPEIAKQEFYLAMPDQEKREALLHANQYPSDFVPFPFLGIPKYTDVSRESAEWDTEIIVDLKKNTQGNIVNQLSEFKEEVLIFLNHIAELTIVNDGKIASFSALKSKPKKVEAESAYQSTTVAIKEKTWQVFSHTEELPEEYQDKNTIEKQYYNLRIAVNQDLSDNYNKLFTYFPTQVPVDLPCLIHGTFELDPTRNHLTNSSRNVFYFKKLALLLRLVAIQLKSEGINWNPYKLLTPTRRDPPDERIKHFYKELATHKKAIDIYPCVDDQYRIFKEAVFHGQEFSEFVVEADLIKFFSTLYRPLPEELRSDEILIKEAYYYSYTYFVKRLTEAARSIKNLTTLAKFIKLFTLPGFRKLKKEDRYPLLVNKSKKQIPVTSTAFTPVSKGKEFDTPSYVNFDFINKTLYAALLDEFNILPNAHQPRELQRQLRDHFNIQPYEPADVIITYIDEARKAIDQAGRKLNEKRSIILEMVKALFIVYSSSKEPIGSENSRVQEAITQGVPLLGRGDKIVKNNSVVFGKDYIGGKLTEELFHGIYRPEQYLATPARWGLSNEDPSIVHGFFTWLKVGNYSHLQKWEESGTEWTQGPYFKYVFTRISKPIYMTTFQGRGTTVAGIDAILKHVGKTLSREKILAWLIKDEKVGKLLEFTDDKSYSNYGGRTTTISPPVNYLRWQFLQSGVFKNYVVDEQGQSGVNPFEINYNDPIFRSNNISRIEIDRKLLLIGAIRSFDDLPVSAVFEILDRFRVNDTDESGRGASSLYTLAVKNFAQPSHRQEAKVHKKIMLHAKCGDQRKYCAPSEIYYADNNTLPKQFTDSKWTLSLPRRKGEVQVSEFFGTKTFEHLKPKVLEPSLKPHPLQSTLDDFLEKARVYILAFRIESLKTPQEKENAADLLEDMSISLTSRCQYTVDDDLTHSLSEGQFIQDQRRFYFQLSLECNTLNKLEKLTSFRDAFAEMLCVLFKITELRNDFRNIVALGLDDTRHLLETEHESSVLEEARSLVQIGFAELHFWRRVFDFLNITFSPKRGSREQLLSGIESVLHIRLPSTYRQVNFEAFDNEISLEFLQLLYKKKRVPVKVCVPTGLGEFHSSRIRERFFHYDPVVRYKVWRALSADRKSQRTFLRKIGTFQPLADDGIKKLTKSCLYTIDVNYDKIVKEYLENSFSIKISEEDHTYKTVQNLYPALREAFEEEWHGLGDMESLAYYKGNGNELLAELKKIRGVEDPMPVDEDEEQSTENIEEIPVIPPGESNMTFVNLKKATAPVPVTTTNNRSSSSAFDVRLNKTFRLAGKYAEKRVRDNLVSVYGRENVQWVSGNSDESYRDDSLGYDIRYRANSNSTWKFVEVKSAPADSFILTNREVEVGKKNKFSYQLALVKHERVLMVDRFFLEEGWAKDFIVEGDYLAVPKDWLVSYIISQVQND